MKPELSEQLFIEELFNHSVEELGLENHEIVSIERLTGDASTRRYYRVFCRDVSYVVCLDNPSNSIDENAFLRVQNFLNEKGIRVPKIIHTNISKGYILEEDLGDVTLLHHLATIESSEIEFELYKKVIDELITLHTLPKQEIEEANIFDLKFDFEKLNFEIEFTVKYFLGHFLGVEEEQTKNEIVELFKPICERLSSFPMVLTHRDFHSRNVMVMNNDLIMIDFQDARWGIPQYDLASLLDDCYYSLTRENQYKILEHYYDKVCPLIHKQGTFESFRDTYEEMALQRVFKAVGSFAYIYHNRKDERYLKYIGFAMEKIKVYMSKNKKYSALRKALFKIYYAS